jgi:glycosyltransferase involved in cell wall biosynthesis
MRMVHVGIYPPPYGGVSVHLKRLLERLEDAGVDWLLFDISGTSKRRSGVMNISWAAAIARLFVMRKSVVHFHNFSPRNTLYFWLLSFRHRTVITLHNELFFEELESHGRLLRMVAGHFLNRLDRIVVVSHHARLLADLIIRNPARIELIPAYIRPESVPSLDDPGVQRLRAQHRFLLASTAFRLEFHRGEDLYGLDLLVDLMRRLVFGRKIDAALVFLLPAVGLPEYFGEIRDRVERAGLSDRIMFLTQPLADGTSLWRVSDLVIRATNTDGNSLTVMEALTEGVPVVASDCVDRPEGSVLFRTRDADDLETRVADVLANLDEHRRRVAGLGSFDMSPRLLDLYEELGVGLAS